MAIIKKGIKYNESPVSEIFYDKQNSGNYQRVKEVRYGDDKLVYFWGEGTQGLTYTLEGDNLIVGNNQSKSFTQVEIPEKTYEGPGDGNAVRSVVEISDSAFRNCSGLESVIIRNNINFIS